jgi:hypothetical protein
MGLSPLLRTEINSNWYDTKDVQNGMKVLKKGLKEILQAFFMLYLRVAPKHLHLSALAFSAQPQFYPFPYHARKQYDRNTHRPTVRRCLLAR